jgi:L-rhamnose mutarotase
MNNNRYAWTWKVKPADLDEYVRMHLAAWPEILAEHSKAGIHNYSIFQNGNQFFYYYECADVAAANQYLAASPDCQRWNAITSKMVEGSFDLATENPIEFMPCVFYLP